MTVLSSEILKSSRGPSGLFIGMRNRKKKDGTFEDIASPANSETRKMIEDRVIGEFKKTAHETVTARAQSTGR